jgi:hypothetical protein
VNDTGNAGGPENIVVGTAIEVIKESAGGQDVVPAASEEGCEPAVAAADDVVSIAAVDAYFKGQAQIPADDQYVIPPAAGDPHVTDAWHLRVLRNLCCSRAATRKAIDLQTSILPKGNWFRRLSDVTPNRGLQRARWRGTAKRMV